MNLFLHFRDLIKSRFSGGVICTLLLLLVSGTVSAEDAIYKVASTSSVTTTGNAPENSNATFKQTYTTKGQITKNNSATLTLTGFTGCTVTGIKLSMKSNKSDGAGTFTTKIGTNTIASIPNATTFNQWYDNTSYSTNYKDINVNILDDYKTYKIGENENIVIEIKATINSLYIDQYTITYTKQASAFNITETSATINAGETCDLSTKITKTEGYNGTITYSSDSESIATVDANGIITGIGEGTANITITASADGSFTEQSETFAITVVKPDLRKDPTFNWSLSSYEPYFDTENKTFPKLNYAEGFNEIITYSSNNEAVATINNNGEINILSAGETTITASFAGNDNWQESTASYILNIKKHITELSFGAETIYNVNLGEAFISPKATAALKNGKDYDGTITYSSSDTNIANINATTGEVEIKSAGTVTITATAEETNAWTEATTSYTLTVIDPNNQTVTFDYTDPASLGLTKPANSASTDITQDISKDIVTMSSTNGGTNTRIWNAKGECDLRVYKGGGSITYTVPNSYVITQIKFTYSSSDKGITTGGNFSSDKTLWTGNKNSVVFTANATARIKTATITYKKLPTVTVTDKKYTTYVTSRAVDFGSEVKAYIVNDVTADKVKTIQINNAPKGTPVIVYAENAGTYTLTEIDEATDDVTSNKLLASDGTIKGGNNIYAMAVKTLGVGFYKVSENVTIPAGKAYLVWEEAPAGNAKEFIPMGGETTGITNISGENGNAKKVYYNLNGMRIDKPQKGIYIVNGKKVIF